ncbi:hypothetical protein [Sphingobacterium sp.]|uniref:hypothetical protein n=1 Tax=Sphingobacterium sp. TaxID=341027 RepID=UPI0031D5ACE6
MIHLIYIYFIINSFLAGMEFSDNKGMALTLLFFGLPLYTLGIIWLYAIRQPLIWIENKSLILGWYRLYFTDYFSKMDYQTIDVRRRQYRGEYENINANNYQRFFLRQIDKKYNYGITVQDNG